MADTQQRSQASQEIEQAAKAAGSPATFGADGITLKIHGGEVQLSEDSLHGGFRVEKLKAPDGKDCERLGRFNLHGAMTALDVTGNLREQETARLEKERAEAQLLEGTRAQTARDEAARDAAKDEKDAAKKTSHEQQHSRQHKREE